MRWDATYKTLAGHKWNRRGVEVSMLIKLVIAGVFLLIMIAFIIAVVNGGFGYSGENSICEKTGWFLRGCT